MMAMMNALALKDSLRQQLQAGAEQLALGLSEAQIKLLMDFLDLLQKWNKVYNLTSVRDPQEMLTHHVLDSLAAVAPLRRHAAALLQPGPGGAPAAVAAAPVRLLDVGSGGGLPGVVFAICCPAVDVSCVDTVGKKAAFIRQAAVALKLRNLHGLHARVETLTQPFDVISCRAFASLPDFVVWSRSALAAPHGNWLAMKAKHPQDEIDALPADVQVFHVEPLTVPGLDVERCIIWMKPA
jgi:16S rRNA (guanine527-N7)-methyltransferase